MSNSEFGRLLTQGLKSIAALEKTELTALQHELGREIGVSVWTIYKWRKGTTIPADTRTITLLATAGVRRGRMDRNWLSRFLQYTRHEDKQVLINELFPEGDARASVTHNLPRRYHKTLIGRDRELLDIKSFLSRRHRVGVVCISGGGGVGKTALALEVAHYYCDEHPNLPPDDRFDTIVWVSAKRVELLPAGQAKRQPTFTDLDGVFRAIAELMDIPAILRTATQAEKNVIMTRLLTENRVLLMLDNLEDVDDQELMVFLRDLPEPSKAIVTTRHRIDVAVPVHLHELDDCEAHELVNLECSRHNITLTEDQVRQLLRRTGGLPLAIVRTIGRMAWRGSSVETEIRQLNDPQNEAYDFCFGKTIALIKPDDAYRLFMALALFASGGSREAVGYVAGFGDDILRRDEGLGDLEVLSLCSKNKDRFELEPMTKTQALAELHADPAFEAEARERWIAWYLTVAEQYGGVDSHEWHVNYDHLDEDWDNILAVIQVCIDAGRYDDVKRLWRHIRDFTHICGYWSDRLRILDWLIAEAERRSEWSTAVQVLCDKGFTLTLTGPSARLEEAQTLLQRAWALHDHAPAVVQARAAALIASVLMRQGAHADAHRWLDTSEELLVSSELTPEVQARELSATLFDRGENALLMGDYAGAEAAFRQMLTQAERSGSQRSAMFAHNFLALTAIFRDNLASAEKHLQLGWPVATRNKEKRLIAFFERTFAYFFLKRGDPDQARHWAAAALDDFERLGMQPETQEMRGLAAQLARDSSVQQPVSG